MVIRGSVAGNFDINNEGASGVIRLYGTSIQLRTAAVDPALTIASSGAATFASSVAATTFGSTIGNDNIVFDTYGATTGYLFSRIKNSSGSLLMGTEGSVTGQVATGDLAYSSGIYTGTTRALHFGVDQTVAMTIINGGNIGMGTTAPGYKLTLNGQPGANGYTLWTNYSDIRLKENITDLEVTNVLDKICAIRPVTYNYNELSGYDEQTRNRRISGFIAQELMEVFPDMVGTIKKENVEYYDTNLSNLNLYLVKAIQEQQAIITSLQEQINELNNK